jgi:hypothetical protein
MNFLCKNADIANDGTYIILSMEDENATCQQSTPHRMTVALTGHINIVMWYSIPSIATSPLPREDGMPHVLSVLT